MKNSAQRTGRQPCAPFDTARDDKDHGGYTGPKINYNTEKKIKIMRDLTLLTDLYQLTMMYGYSKSSLMNKTAVFDVFTAE